MCSGKIIQIYYKWLKDAGYVLVLVQYMEDPKASFDTKKEPKYLNKTETRSEVKKYILAKIVSRYI